MMSGLADREQLQKDAVGEKGVIVDRMDEMDVVDILEDKGTADGRSGKIDPQAWWLSQA